jgi:hypothetical protein
MSDKLALYFGYTIDGSGGHFLHDPHGGIIFRSHAPNDIAGFPWHSLVDGGLLGNRKVPDQPDGRVHWTCGGNPDLWFAFFWWDRSGDRRGNSNSGFYVRGFGPATLTHETAEAAAPLAFAHACEKWPQVVARQLFPLVLQASP